MPLRMLLLSGLTLLHAIPLATPGDALAPDDARSTDTHAPSPASRRAASQMLPSVSVAALERSQHEELRAACARESWWIELDDRFICPLPLGRGGSALLPTAGADGERLLTDPDASRYRLARGRELPAALRGARVGGGSDVHVIYVGPAAADASLEREAVWRPLDSQLTLERMVGDAWRAHGDRSFGGLASLERGANAVAKGNWHDGGWRMGGGKSAPADLADEPAQLRTRVEEIVGSMSVDKLKGRLEKLAALPSRHVGSAEYHKAFAHVRAELAAIDGLAILPETDDRELERLGPRKSPKSPRVPRKEPNAEPEADLERAARRKLHSDSWAGRNVVAKLEGTNPKLAPALVGAHLDCMPPGERAPGAEDNASGLSVMMQTAAALAAGPRPERTVLFAAFGGEEIGMVGSGAWADRHLGERGEKLHGALLLDEVGWRAPDGGGVQFETSRTGPNMDLVDELGRNAISYAGGGDALALHVSTQPYGSDHMSFLAHPAAVPKVALLINANDRDYPHYHQDTDTPASIDYDLMSAIGKVTASTVAKWAHPSWAHDGARDGATEKSFGRHTGLERHELERSAAGGAPAGLSLADAVLAAADATPTAMSLADAINDNDG